MSKIDTNSLSDDMNNRDYIGDDGLLHCGICHEAKEAYFPEDAWAAFGRKTHASQCVCERKKVKAEEEERLEREKRQTISRLRSNCFQFQNFASCTFENSKWQTRQYEICKKLSEEWKDWKKQKGLLFWGDVGSGKTYMAACMANALIEKMVSVRMLNLSFILNAPFEGRNELIKDLTQTELLIIDDFGSERSTEFGLEIVHSVIDARYNSHKPMILTTNLTLDEMRSADDVIHKKIYDRVLTCTPIFFPGSSLRKQEGQENMERIKQILEKETL